MKHYILEINKIPLLLVLIFPMIFVSGKLFSMTPKEAVNIINTYAEEYAKVADLFLTRNIKRLKHPKDEIKKAIFLMLPATEGEVCENLKILFVELDTFVDSNDWEGFATGELLKLSIGDIEESAEAFLKEYPKKRSEIELEIVLKQQESLKELPDCS